MTGSFVHGDGETYVGGLRDTLVASNWLCCNHVC